MEIEKTCGNCPFLKISGTKRAAFAGCIKTGFIVPHSWDGQKDENQFVFWRIPTECPLQNSDILKSEKQAPKKDWVVKSLADFEVKE